MHGGVREVLSSPPLSWSTRRLPATSCRFFPHECRQSGTPENPFRIALCSDVGACALGRRPLSGRANCVLPLGVCDSPGGGDLCLARRAGGGCAYRPPVPPSRARAD